MCAWINQLMAVNLMKWWKSKILSGYRQFSDCNEGKVSDTEELLGRLTPDSACPIATGAACTTPPPNQLAASSSPSSSPAPSRRPSSRLHQHRHQQAATPHQHLNLEEFSCDVSVEGGMDKRAAAAAGKDNRQEFSFTLYDFDGHGKITKDDIAGLVTTIYEVLGSSVTVPHYGSKTIRVKLTVSPDQRKHVSATVINNQKENKEKSNVTAAQQHKKKKKERHRRHHQCCHHEEDVANSDESDICSRISGYEAEDIDDDQLDRHFRNRPKKQHQLRAPSPNPKYTIPNLFIRDNNLINRKEAFQKNRRWKRKSSTLQRQELLEIIQANMELNNLCFQPARKQCTNHVSLETRKLQKCEERIRRHRHRNAKLQTTPVHCLANFMDPAHFYVDLAALQNTTHLPNSPYEYDKLMNAVMCVSNNNRKTMPNNPNKPPYYYNNSGKHHQHVPMSNNIPVRYHQPLNNIENVMYKGIRKTVKTVEIEPLQPAFKRNVKKYPEVVLGHTSSPHHLKHRNRQEDQARAMAQVHHWLEQEFSPEDNEKKEKPYKGDPPRDKHTSATNTSTESGVERHEHHHVHEHIHHHYHHYQETPIVV